MAELITIEVDASDFRDEMLESVGAFRDAIAEGRPYPLTGLLTTEMLYPRNPEVIPLLKRRGDLRTEGGVLVNSFAIANSVRYEFLQEGRPIAVKVTAPAEIVIAPTLGDDEDRLKLKTRWPLLIMDEVIYKGQRVYFREPFYLSEVVSRPGVLEYRFEDEAGGATGVIRAVYEGEALVAPHIKIRNVRDVAALMKLVSIQTLDPADPCGDVSPTRPLPLPLPNGQRILAHVRLLDPNHPSVQDQVDKAVELFRSYGLNLDIRSYASINRPDLMDVDVGACVSGQTTPEQDALHALRGGIGVNEIALYFVRSTVPPLGGCAAFRNAQRPACVVARASSIWTLAHEIGHVLGLFHVNGADRLMTGGGTGNITNPPPDLSQGELRTVAGSPYVRDPAP